MGWLLVAAGIVWSLLFRLIRVGLSAGYRGLFEAALLVSGIGGFLILSFVMGKPSLGYGLWGACLTAAYAPPSFSEFEQASKGKQLLALFQVLNLLIGLTMLYLSVEAV